VGLHGIALGPDGAMEARDGHVRLGVVLDLLEPKVERLYDVAL
jgi:hypothetical protein